VNLSNLEEQPASILIDGEVLFALSDDDLLKLEDLKKNLQQNLKDEAITRKISMKYMDRVKSRYFDLHPRDAMEHDGGIDLTKTSVSQPFHICVHNNKNTTQLYSGLQSTA
jgi:hypothetical protein